LKGSRINRLQVYWAVGLAMGILFLFANDGFRSLVHSTRETQRVEKNLKRLRKEHESLLHEWTQIQDDPSYTEYLIRKNLGYVKKGEVEYQILVSSHSM